jgi:hypothetical protein
MTSVWPNGPGGKALKIKVIGHDSGDTEEFTRLEVKARRRQWEILDYYQRQENKPWHFDHASPIIGLRETRCIAGDYVLNVDDLRAGRAFDDAVARGTFYLDGMRPDDEKRTYFLSKEEQCIPPYHIPFRSLIARDADSLLMAERCKDVVPVIEPYASAAPFEQAPERMQDDVLNGSAERFERMPKYAPGTGRLTVGGNIWVVYSIAKEQVGVTRIPVSALPAPKNTETRSNGNPMRRASSGSVKPPTSKSRSAFAADGS